MLLDTSGLFCLHHAAEAFHQKAVDAYRSAQRRFTHNLILAELVALANARHIPRPSALSFVVDLVDSPDIEVVWVDAGRHRQALAFLLTRLDKSYSLCDAVSFLIMRERNVVEALTTDRHFEQEGFQRLLV